MLALKFGQSTIYEQFNGLFYMYFVSFLTLIELYASDYKQRYGYLMVHFYQLPMPLYSL